jgi:D-lactate dehydrogenase
MARHFGLVETCARFALRAGHVAQSIAGARVLNAVTRAVRAAVRRPTPLWTRDVPMPRRGRIPGAERDGARAVYFPSCISRTMGPMAGEVEEMSVMTALVLLAERAEVPVFLPRDAKGACCGVPFSSKGYDTAHRVAVNHTIERCWAWSDQGTLPIVVDTTPCTYGLLSCRADLSEENRQRFDRLEFVDAIAFAHDTLLPRLIVNRRLRSVVLHPVCSAEKLGLAGKLSAVARACSEEVVVPLHANCCGFAGDRGFLFPELTAAASRLEGEEVRGGRHDGHYSSSRTCEIGMTRAAGHVYRSFLFLLEECTRR